LFSENKTEKDYFYFKILDLDFAIHIRNFFWGLFCEDNIHLKKKILESYWTETKNKRRTKKEYNMHVL
jgi:hypothetical protein